MFVERNATAAIMGLISLSECHAWHECFERLKRFQASISQRLAIFDHVSQPR
jgi:hypothetical protein